MPKPHACAETGRPEALESAWSGQDVRLRGPLTCLPRTVSTRGNANACLGYLSNYGSLEGPLCPGNVIEGDDEYCFGAGIFSTLSWFHYWTLMNLNDGFTEISMEISYAESILSEQLNNSNSHKLWTCATGALSAQTAVAERIRLAQLQRRPTGLGLGQKSHYFLICKAWDRSFATFIWATCKWQSLKIAVFLWGDLALEPGSFFHLIIYKGRCFQSDGRERIQLFPQGVPWLSVVIH